MNAVADTTTLRSIFGIAPDSAIGQLLYPVVVLLLTNAVKLAKGAIAKWPQALPQAGAVVLGLATTTLVQGQGFTLPAILSGATLGLAAIGLWEVAGKRAVDTAKRVSAPALLAMLVLMALALAWAGRSEARPVYDPHRLSMGAGVAGVIYEDRGAAVRTSGFQPNAYASWSLTDRFSAATLFSRDFARHFNEFQGGLRFSAVGYQPSDRMQVALGLDYVRYGDHGADAYEHKSSWQASVRLSFSVVQKKTLPARDIVFAAGAVEYDPQNGARVANGVPDPTGEPGGLVQYKLGPRVQILGGKWGD